MAVYQDRGLIPAYHLGAVELASLGIWLRGDTASALETVATALERHALDSVEPLDRPYTALAGFYSLAGQPDQARELLVEWETIVPPDLRRTQENQRHHAWGTVAMAEGRPEEALVEFRFAHERVEYPMWQLPLLGRVYESLGEGDSAVAMYERYLTTPYHARVLGLDSPTLGGGYSWLPVVYERLGAIYEQRGDSANAILYYGKLVELWKDADPELQPRVEATRRAIDALSPER